jgi:hypothetical protein
LEQRVREPDLIERSARGGRAALAEMVNRCLNKQFNGFTPFECWTYAEVFARLAAAHGSFSDRLKLSAILRVRALHVAEIGDPERGAAIHAEAEELSADLTNIHLCDGLEILAGVLTGQIETGLDEASQTLDRILAALLPEDADALRNTINNAARELSAETTNA